MQIEKSDAFCRIKYDFPISLVETGARVGKRVPHFEANMLHSACAEGSIVPVLLGNRKEGATELHLSDGQRQKSVALEILINRLA
jgi:hypothetical protein